jgi:hypothetical protein
MLVILALTAIPTAIDDAARVLTNTELYERAQHAADRKEFVEAMVFIYAYLQRDSDYLLKDSTARARVWEFYSQSADQVQRALHPESDVRYGMSAPSSLPARNASMEPPRDTPVDTGAPALSVIPSHPGYPLVCRGGAPLYFSYQNGSGVLSGPQIWIRFERGTAGAGANKENAGMLGPGQCTWLDRAISPAEPDTLVLGMALFPGRQFAIAWRRGQPASLASELTEIAMLQREDVFRTFRAYNNAQGHFIVTAVE